MAAERTSPEVPLSSCRSWVKINPRNTLALWTAEQGVAMTLVLFAPTFFKALALAINLSWGCWNELSFARF